MKLPLRSTLLAAATLVAASTALAVDGTWTNTAGGSWASAANWSGSTLASGTDSIANFNTLDITAAAQAGTVVTLDGAQTIGTLNFGDTNTAAGNIWSLNTGTGGTLTLAVSSGNAAITGTNASARLNIGAVLAGSNNITFSGTAAGVSIRLGAANTYTGKTTISGGATVGLGSGATFGATPGAAVADQITLNGGTISNFGTADTVGNRSIAANFGITLGASGGTFNVGNAGLNITVSGIVTGGGALTKSNSGELILNGANTYTGGTSLSAGTIRAGNDSALGTAASLLTLLGGTIASTGATARTFSNTWFVANNATNNFGDATGTGALTFNGAGQLSSSGTDRTLNTVVDTTFAGVISGSNTLTVTKTGAGTLTLSGASANTVVVTTGWLINAGTVAADKLAAFGSVTGTNGKVTLGGGSLTTGVAAVNTGAFTMNNATSQITLNGTGAGTITLASGRALSISAGTWNIDLANGKDSFASAGGSAAFSISGLTLDLGDGAINYANSYALITGFTGVNSVSGLTIRGYDTANFTAALDTAGTLSFIPTAVPEPSTYGLIGAGALAVVAAGRRRRKTAGRVA